jgi:hypothetical protein
MILKETLLVMKFNNLPFERLRDADQINYFQKIS